MSQDISLVNLLVDQEHHIALKAHDQNKIAHLLVF